MSLHDVAPPFEPEVRAQIEALAAVGIERLVLKVVPNWQGCHPLTTAPTLIQLLREQVMKGSELVLHGYEHQGISARYDWSPSGIRGRLFARHAAEFLTLPRAEAVHRLEAGQELLERAGLPQAQGFCAPGWLLGPETEQAATDVGLRSIVGMFSWLDLASGRRGWMASRGYMGATGKHELGIRALNGLISAAIPVTSLAKIYLHPQGGIDNPFHARAIATAGSMVKAGWQPSTYADLASQ